MTMNDFLTLTLALAGGLALGALFFGGLWWTVRKGVLSQWSVLWFPGSMLLRTSIVLVGFYFVGRGHWDRMLLCFLGFIVARMVVTQLTRPSEENKRCLEPEIRHAP